MYEQSKEATACLGCSSQNMHGLGVDIRLANPTLRKLAATFAPASGKTFVPPGGMAPPTVGIQVPGITPDVGVPTTFDETAMLNDLPSGSPPWLVPLAVGVGGLALVGGVLAILKKKGKI